MKKKREDIIDFAKLSKKYRTNVKRIVSLWQKGKDDFEVSSSLGIDYFSLKQLRYEIEQAHLRHRYQSWINSHSLQR